MKHLNATSYPSSWQQCPNCGEWYDTIFSSSDPNYKVHTCPNKNIEWQDKFIKEFGIHFEFAEGELQFAIGFIEGLLSAQRSELEHKIRTMFTADEVLAMKNGLKGEIMTLINREIAIAHTKDKGGKTSRLTSLAMRVSELLKT